MANKKIEEIEGIGPSYGEKLRAAGVEDTDSLLERGATAKGRTELAEKSGLTEKQILKWVNMADLFRINGVGQEFAELLEVAGVDTVPELGQRIAANLATKMVEVNDQKKLTRRVPNESEIAKWIEEAKKLPKKVMH